MTKYVHDQTSASAIWSITHNLGSKPVFDVLVDDGGNLVKAFPQYVEYISDNQVEITFSSVRTGKVILSTQYSANPDQTPPPAGDPYWANVQSLLHFNGTNGSTSFTDEKGLTWTSINACALSTSSPKFGSASLYANSPSHQFINNSNSSTWNITSGQDFTFEMFAKFSAAGDNALIGRWKSTGTWPNHILLRHSGGNFQLYWNNAGIINVAHAITWGDWYHIAWTRSSGVQRLFVNGTQIGSVSNNTGISSSDGLSLGSETASPTYSFGVDTLNGYIDEFRFTKGYARYTSNFTSPVAEFLNS